METLSDIAVPLPPLAEQRRIVAEVERRLSVVDEMEAVVGASLKRSERLRQAILKRAFEGSLVSQDPNDESASVLLERIRAGRDHAQHEQQVGQRERATKGKRQVTGRRLGPIFELSRLTPTQVATERPVKSSER